MRSNYNSTKVRFAYFGLCSGGAPGEKKARVVHYQEPAEANKPKFLHVFGVMCIEHHVEGR
jgi:hypothetical protein